MSIRQAEAQYFQQSSMLYKMDSTLCVYDTLVPLKELAKK